MINRSGYFGLRRKQWIQLSWSKNTQRRQATGSAEIWPPTWEGQTSLVELTAGWHSDQGKSTSIKHFANFFYGKYNCQSFFPLWTYFRSAGVKELAAWAMALTIIRKNVAHLGSNTRINRNLGHVKRRVVMC